MIYCKCWFYGGRKTGELGEKPSEHGRGQLPQFYSTLTWVLSLRVNTWLYPCRWSPIQLQRSPTRLNIRHLYSKSVSYAAKKSLAEFFKILEILTVETNLSLVQRCNRSPMLTSIVPSIGRAATNSPFLWHTLKIYIGIRYKIRTRNVMLRIL